MNANAITHTTLFGVHVASHRIAIPSTSHVAVRLFKSHLRRNAAVKGYNVNEGTTGKIVVGFTISCRMNCIAYVCYVGVCKCKTTPF